uniref:Uncharacterized protein n=1 Tax=Arundo donax TaxID=35708 RepID=A0A0A9BH03_ARUDO
MCFANSDLLVFFSSSDLFSNFVIKICGITSVSPIVYTFLLHLVSLI